jgi:signal transduction histidine kinase
VHTETDERRLDGTPMRIEGDYMVIHDDQRRIAGHFGIQRDITDRYLAAEQLRSATGQLRALATRLQRVREEERTSIAREIHDELGQALTGLKLDVSWMKRGRPAGDPLAAQCAAILNQIDQTMSSVRRIATALRPSVLDQLGVAAALEWQGQEFGTRTGIAVAIDLAVDDSVPIPDDLGSSVFRILQEALTNVARHARAARVQIGFTVTPAELGLTITDDGIGLPAAPLDGAASLGIVGMRERALASGGEFTIGPAAGRGTRVSLRVPLRAGAA